MARPLLHLARRSPIDGRDDFSSFLGMSIACAKCHNHPMEKWTNDEYYQFANLFARVRAKAVPLKDETSSSLRPAETSSSPCAAGRQTSASADATSAIEDPHESSRAVADWLVSPQNPYFSRAIVNRVWPIFRRRLGGSGGRSTRDEPFSNEKLSPRRQSFLPKIIRPQALMRAIPNPRLQRASKRSPETRRYTFLSIFTYRAAHGRSPPGCILQVLGVPTEFQTDRATRQRVGRQIPPWHSGPSVAR